MALCLSVDNSHTLEKIFCVLAAEANLTHVRNIKDANALSAMEMLGYTTGGITNGHVVTSEWYNTSFHRVLVEIVKCCLTELCGAEVSGCD